MFNDWTMARKLRFSLSGLSGLAIFAIVVILLQRNFPDLDDHIIAVIAQAISVPLGILFAIGIYKPIMLKLFPDKGSNK